MPFIKYVQIHTHACIHCVEKKKVNWNVHLQKNSLCVVFRMVCTFAFCLPSLLEQQGHKPSFSPAKSLWCAGQRWVTLQKELMHGCCGGPCTGGASHLKPPTPAFPSALQNRVLLLHKSICLSACSWLEMCKPFPCQVVDTGVFASITSTFSCSVVAFVHTHEIHFSL